MPNRLTPCQRQALQYLREGWRCETGGAIPPRLGNLLWYSFRRDGQHAYVAGSTLASLQRRGLIGWEETTVTLAWDGSTMPGYVLVLTEKGRQQE